MDKFRVPCQVYLFKLSESTIKEARENVTRVEKKIVSAEKAMWEQIGLKHFNEENPDISLESTIILGEKSDTSLLMEDSPTELPTNGHEIGTMCTKKAPLQRSEVLKAKVNLHLENAVSLAEMNNFKKSIEESSAALRLDPSSILAKRIRAVCFGCLGLRETALLEFEDLLSKASSEEEKKQLQMTIATLEKRCTDDN